MTPVLTWRQLRELAEEVQGRQHENLGIENQNGKLVPVRMVQGNSYVATIPATPQKQKKVTLIADPPILVESTQQTHTNIEGIADAAFWTVAAVEKFLVPYYASFKEADDPDANLLTQFKQEDVVAILHLPNSEPTTGTSKTGLFKVVANSKKAANAPYSLHPIN